MASLRLEHIYKVYPNGTKAVNDFTLDIKDGEFIVFVGPSGCGKSTTLRMVAGLEEISAGELYIGDTIVNDMEPKDRDVAMVFQNYALYPHMTVYENMAFGLTLRHVPRNEIHEKVMWAAEVLGLKEYLDRKPKAMSGGQRQRVSLGRAILRNPKVMLLDEPLSNLDAKLRSQMRSEISKLHQRLATTFIYVTHDQVEAMTLGTRVVVMKLGVIQQCDTPKNLYDFPVNKFVAGFIGTPQMNFFDVSLLRKEGVVDINFLDCKQEPLHSAYSDIIKAKKQYLDGKQKITLGIRCENISIEDEDVAKGDNLINVVISHFEELGNETLIYGDLNENTLTYGTSPTAIIIKARNNHGLKPGQVIKARVDVNKAHFFDSKTEKTILPKIPNENIFPIKIHGDDMHMLSVNAKKPSAIAISELEDGSIDVPIDAIKIGGKGYEAVIEKIEVVDGKVLAYLSSGPHMFFAILNKKEKVGSKVSFSVNYDLCSIYDAAGNPIQKPLAPRDDLVANFANFKTAYGVTKNEEFSELRASRIEATKAQFAAERKALESEQVAAHNAIDTSNLEQIRAENEQKIQKAREENALATKRLNEEHRVEMSKAKAEHKANVKRIKGEVKAEYKKMLDDETADFKLLLSTNRDPDAIRARRMTYDAFKESLPTARQNDLGNRLNSESFEFDTAKNAIAAKFSRDKFELKATIDELVANARTTGYPVEVLEEEYATKFEELDKKEKEALLHADLMFFFVIDGHYQLIPDDITGKIIQGLGSKVFSKSFRISVPHDAYEEAPDGFEAKIEEVIDYGSDSYYKLSATLYEAEKVLYIKADGAHQKGDVLNLRPVLPNTEIYEMGMNIRLY